VKAALGFCVFTALVASGCATRSNDSLDRAARQQANPVRIEFARASRFYEEGDALFAMVNDSRQLLWFLGRGPDQPAYEIKANFITDQNAPIATKGASGRERYPLAPGETRYFTVNAANAPQPLSIGLGFFTSFTGTNTFVIWSGPATFTVKR
jgi:hypothetical protein